MFTKEFHYETYRQDFRVQPIGNTDDKKLNDWAFFNALQKESGSLRFYLADLLLDVQYFTQAEPDTKFIWMPYGSGTHLYHMDGSPKVDDFVNSVLNNVKDTKMYIVHKRKRKSDVDPQTYTMSRLTDKSQTPAQICKEDTQNEIETALLFVRNELDRISFKESFSDNSKEYLQDIAKNNLVRKYSK